MTSINVEAERGNAFLHTGSMNGGKSLELVVLAIDLSEHSKYKVVAFIPKNDTRSGDFISALGDTHKLQFQAQVIDQNEPETILNKIHEMDESGRVDIVIIDEIQFFKPSLYNVVKRLKEERRVVALGGLYLDFRGEPFGATPYIMPLLSRVHFHYPTCSIVNGGERCSREAKYTARFLKDDSKNDPDLVDFELKRGTVVWGKYKWAPYYDVQVKVENKEGEPATKEQDKKVRVYTSVCEQCFKVPKKHETEMIQQAISNSRGMNIEEIRHGFSKFGDLDNILNCLIAEQRIVLHNGLYIPQAWRGVSEIPNYFIPLKEADAEAFELYVGMFG